VRFASKLTGPVQFVAGGFYQERHTNNGSYGAMINPTTGELPPAAQQQIFFDSLTVASFKNRALFGEVNYTPIERLTLTAGIRYFQLEHDSQATAIVNFFGGALGAGPVLGSTVNKAVYKGEASYQLTDNALAYLTYSQGFREGGENSPALHGTFPLTYNPDYVDNYEVGWKTQWLDRQLTLNGAVYYMLWQDIQVSQYDSTGAFTYTSNAGRARLYGVELEGVARPQVLPGLTANFSMRYSEQELTQDNPNAAAGDLFAGLKGNTIPNSFPWQADAGLEQRLSFGEWHPFGRFDATYTGKAHTQFSLEDPTDRVWGNFVLCNLRVGVEEARWSAALYAKNVFDRRAIVNWDVQQVPGIPDLVLTTQPREIGLQFALNL
jgi:outer membrane receptor protein involved in Fe transport